MGRTVERMSRHDRLRDHAQRINARIRRLMAGPATRQRTAEYERLLIQWEEATRGDVDRAA